ncbi:MAG: hypothetical protein AAGF47_03300 [Planctomycetota bacterium]
MPVAVANDAVRIASLSPAATVMLRDMGLDALLVGRHGWDTTADESLPVVGDQTGIDYERLLGVRPTHVVIEWGARDVPERLARLADNRGMSIVPFETLRLADIVTSAQRLRDAFGAAGGGEQTAAVVDAVSALNTPGAPAPEVGRVLLIAGVSPTVDCLGPGSAHQEILTAAGFLPALAEGGPWMTLSLEDAIAIDPDTIVLVMPSASGDTESLLGPLARMGIAAVSAARIVLIDDPEALIPSSSLVGFRQELEDRLLALPPLVSPREQRQEPRDGPDRPG